MDKLSSVATFLNVEEGRTDTDGITTLETDPHKFAVWREIEMMTPFGRCPICMSELHNKGMFLVCPAEDYRARSAPFQARWARFFDDALAAVRAQEVLRLTDELLEDLQRMKVME